MVRPPNGSSQVLLETVPAARAPCGKRSFALVPNSTFAVVSAGGARIAFPHAKAAADHPFLLHVQEGRYPLWAAVAAC